MPLVMPSNKDAEENRVLHDFPHLQVIKISGYCASFQELNHPPGLGLAPRGCFLFRLLDKFLQEKGLTSNDGQQYHHCYCI
jgi:hypothetical protein